MTYAGIGSRETPPDILALMFRIGRDMAASGYKLRSGHADGADSAFEDGCGLGPKEIWRASDATLYRKTWFDLAAAHHPAWSRCSTFARRLHARNGPIVLGEYLNDPVKLVVCWTPDGKASGGTGQALRIAEACNPRIPVNNLHDAETRDRWDKWCRP